MNEICRMSAVELAQNIVRKELRAIEVVDAMLARIEECSNVHAFVCTVAEQARQAAKKVDQDLHSGQDGLPPLLGIPYSAKDVTNCAGVPTRYGSLALPAFLPSEDNLAVSRAKVAGAILLGKTATPELAHKAFTYSPLSGLTLNPFHPEVTSGGSSGGAAVAVALGMGPIALGTDGGGSVRIPAACCGVVGLKPSIGSLPDHQAQDLFGVTAHAGPLARSVADIRFFYRELEGGHIHDPYSQGRRPALRELHSLKGVRVAWLLKCGNKEVDTEVERLSKAAVNTMQDLGAIVEVVELDFARLEPHFLVLMESRVARSLRALDEKSLSKVDPSLLTHYDRGVSHTAMDYMDALSERATAFRQVQDVFERFDVIASPTMSAPPLAHAQDPHGSVIINGNETGRVRAEWYPYTMAFNLTGHPAISIPCGYTNSGLPVGFHLAARWYDEAYLLDVAEILEKELAVPTLSM
ncbi:amidase [Pusillimonas sp. ANT_WB101]|uniref:amidase n=1 Tax=Pusillimonas sp. ANT_WB101 TaxID=2597356 RepID=UPI00165D8B3E|nr:amidase family protein [Pusillimonas sp. ANT_WB101]